MQRAAGQEENCFEARRMGAKSLYSCRRAGTGADAGAAVALFEVARTFRSLWSLFGSQGLQLPGNCAVLVKPLPRFCPTWTCAG